MIRMRWLALALVCVATTSVGAQATKQDTTKAKVKTAIKKAAKNTGAAVSTAAKDTKNAVGTAGKQTGAAVGTAAKDTKNAVVKAAKDTKAAVKKDSTKKP